MTDDQNRKQRVDGRVAKGREAAEQGRERVRSSEVEFGERKGRDLRELSGKTHAEFELDNKIRAWIREHEDPETGHVPFDQMPDEFRARLKERRSGPKAQNEMAQMRRRAEALWRENPERARQVREAAIKGGLIGDGPLHPKTVDDVREDRDASLRRTGHVSDE